MVPEIAHFALILALCLALTQALFPVFVLLWREHLFWLDLAKPAALGQFILVALSVVCFASEFIHNDFTVAYIAQHSNIHLAWNYRLAALWSAPAGALLLWLLLLNVWSAAVCCFTRSAFNHRTQALVLMTLGWISSAILLFLLMHSDLFFRVFDHVSAEGTNVFFLLPFIHFTFYRPILYLGCTGFTLILAFIIAGLLTDQLAIMWQRVIRSWGLIVWLLSLLGLMTTYYLK